ncbi:AlpA family transcriptional regulator [Chitinibacter sp. GC72]|uniref:helix-turn-helix transcriptional regulator n=1 Tax=Chitinibacter sp. GC72 TaxID=1526917 RepID=UPI001E3CA2FB|nr:helix-turn-helix domain-containing protein [Chitinibacter sp. GC72]
MDTSLVVSAGRLTPQQLAERWGFSPNTLTRWRHEGIGPLYLKLGGRVLYRLEDIEQYELHSLHKDPATRIAPQGTMR